MPVTEDGDGEANPKRRDRTSLTDREVQLAKPGEKNRKMSDSGGLFLFVTTKGHKSWRLKYRFGGSEKLLVLGSYPDVSLRKARELRDDAKRLLRDDRDPAVEQRKRRIDAHAAAGATFRKHALAWHEAQKGRWSPVHIRKVEQALKRDLLPELGALPLAEIDGPTVLAVLRKVERRGAIDTAKRLRQHVSAIFQVAIAEGVVGHDPAAIVGKGLLPTPVGGRQPAVRTFSQARELLIAMDGCSAEPATKFASRLLALTATRPGVVQGARWEEFRNIDWDDPETEPVDPRWRVPAARMKLSLRNKAEEAFDHEMPLQRQAIDLLRQQRRMTGAFEFVFIGRRSPQRPMSENAMNYMYARNGYSGRHVPHGWRSTFSTVMNEQAVKNRRPDDRAIIDGMLAHRLKGLSATEEVYNRALHWERRREIAEEWADLIMEGLPPAAELMRPRGR